MLHTVRQIDQSSLGSAAVVLTMAFPPFHCVAQVDRHTCESSSLPEQSLQGQRIRCSPLVPKFAGKWEPVVRSDLGDAQPLLYVVDVDKATFFYTHASQKESKTK